MKHQPYSFTKVILVTICLTGLMQNTLAGKKKHSQFNKDNCVDFIIIGMGTAGAVLAERLSADKKYSVIGLEAGDNDNNDPAIIIPANGYTAALPNFYPQYFWQGEGVPQFDNLVGQSFQWTSGRLLGGSSMINGLQDVWGSNAYWSRVEAALGSDWALEKTLARYKALETYITPVTPSPARGTNGPWTNMALPVEPTRDANYLVDSMAAVSGAPTITEYNNPLTPIGQFLRWDLQERPVGNTLLREGSSYAFLGPDVMTPDGFGIDRDLRVHLRATAIDLIWDGDRVKGVRFTQNGKCHEIYAKKEVIVSAGFQSAQFLQRNGIGPKEVLDAAGIPVRVDNPRVGAIVNQVGVSAVVATPGAVLTPLNEAGVSYPPGAFLPRNTPITDPASVTREVQWIILNAGPDAIALFALGLNPKSVGTIAVQNDDPLKIPLVNENYLSNPEDLETLIDAFQNFLQDLNNYFAVNPAPNGATWSLIFPDPTVVADRGLLTEFIKTTLIQTHHFTSACLAARTKADGVVDPRGRVFGTQGLRVADVSILLNPDGNTATPAVLVGWTISEFLLEEYAKNCKRAK